MPSVPDAGSAPDVAPPGSDSASGSIRDRCFPGIGDPSKPLPNYDQFAPVVGSHCKGTNHQAITGIEKVVFLGDSITEGTPPTSPTEYYRARVADALGDRFGTVETAECAAWGARTDDLLEPPHQQILECFPGVEPKRTLVVMTVGGNDMHAALGAASEGQSMDEVMAGVDQAIAYMDTAVRWFRDDPARFPNGIFVVFANVYEFTDGEGDFVASCPAAALDGVMDWPEGRTAWIRVNEALVRIAVETQTDVVFLGEHFCGHGFHAGESDNECYRGDDAETWFDFTCTHPNPAGHAAIADLVMAVVDE